MSLSFLAARAVSSIATWILRNVFHRPAATFPGDIALSLDPHLIADLRPKVQGSILVVGTNGKTTVTNLLADIIEREGKSVICNRTGANLNSGVATALLQGRPSDWGVFECDELWLAKVLPYLRSDYVLLLNLFQDQLDRMGEIERIQASIVQALTTTPQTVLLYNADDPHCAAIADRVENPSISLGTLEPMALSAASEEKISLCQQCSEPLTYTFRQYGQLGDYYCTSCGFARPPLVYGIKAVSMQKQGMSFTLHVNSRSADKQHGCGVTYTLQGRAAGAYLVYNIAFVAAAAHLLGCSPKTVQSAVHDFNPQNGRLQTYTIGGRDVLLNLAKNPTGFDQNIDLILQDQKPKTVAFFVNDKTGDGHDISWLWDVDFEALAQGDNDLFFAGGIRKNSLQVRLNYAGIPARLVNDSSDVFAQLRSVPVDRQLYIIANYTALAPVHAALDKLQASYAAPLEVLQIEDGAAFEKAPQMSTKAKSRDPLVIARLLPDLLNGDGDSKNAEILAWRLRQRGIPAKIVALRHGDSLDLSDVDMVCICGGTKSEQRYAFAYAHSWENELRAYIEKDGVVFAAGTGCGLLCQTYCVDGEEVAGLGLVEAKTVCSGHAPQLVALRSPCASLPVVGYESPIGVLQRGKGVYPFGVYFAPVQSGGADDKVKASDEGLRYRNVIGTSLHGAMLAENPEVADALLAAALAYHGRRCNEDAPVLTPLDDRVCRAANQYICKTLQVPLLK